jgi:hypothetical protein
MGLTFHRKNVFQYFSYLLYVYKKKTKKNTVFYRVPIGLSYIYMNLKLIKNNN